MRGRAAHASPRPRPVRYALATLAFAALVVATATTAVVHTKVRPLSVTVPTGPLHWTSSMVPLTYDGLDRSYLLLHPLSGFRGTLPVVVMLQGHSVTPIEEEDRDDWIGLTGPAIVVLPTATGPAQNQGWNAGNCCGYPLSADIDDVGFIEAVTAAVLATFHDADPARVYLAGYSNGGKMALAMACDDPRRWAAVAVYGTTASETCKSQAPVSFAFVGSTGDVEIDLGDAKGVPIKDPDGFVEPTVPQQVALFATADRCAAPVTTTLGVLTEATATCAGGRQVATDLYTGGGHALALAGGGAPSAIQVMWDFFKPKVAEGSAA